MRKIIMALGALLFSAATSAQGTLQFNNRIAGVLDAPVSRWDGTGPGPRATAELVLVGPGGSTTVLFPRTTFRSTSAAAAHYVVPVDVTVPGVLPGGTATVIFRAFDNQYGSYEEAARLSIEGAHGYVFVGQSNEVVVSGLGGEDPNGGPPILPPALIGLQGFTPVPEPTVFALALCGAASLLWRRRPV